MKVVHVFENQLSFDNVDTKDIAHPFCFLDGFVSFLKPAPHCTKVLAEQPFCHALCSHETIHSFTQPCTIYIAKHMNEGNKCFGACDERDIKVVWEYLSDFERRFS